MKIQIFFALFFFQLCFASVDVTVSTTVGPQLSNENVYVILTADQFEKIIQLSQNKQRKKESTLFAAFMKAYIDKEKRKNRIPRRYFVYTAIVTFFIYKAIRATYWWLDFFDRWYPTCPLWLQQWLEFWKNLNSSCQKSFVYNPFELFDYEKYEQKFSDFAQTMEKKYQETKTTIVEEIEKKYESFEAAVSKEHEVVQTLVQEERELQSHEVAHARSLVEEHVKKREEVVEELLEKDRKRQEEQLLHEREAIQKFVAEEREQTRTLVEQERTLFQRQQQVILDEHKKESAVLCEAQNCMVEKQEKQQQEFIQQTVALLKTMILKMHQESSEQILKTTQKYEHVVVSQCIDRLHQELQTMSKEAFIEKYNALYKEAAIQEEKAEKKATSAQKVEHEKFDSFTKTEHKKEKKESPQTKEKKEKKHPGVSIKAQEYEPARELLTALTGYCYSFFRDLGMDVPLSDIQKMFQ